MLASGSVRMPRFTLLESGGLQISPVFIQDAGTYTCYAANTEGSLNASATLTVWSKDATPRAPPQPPSHPRPTAVSSAQGPPGVRSPGHPEQDGCHS